MYYGIESQIDVAIKEAPTLYKIVSRLFFANVPKVITTIPMMKTNILRI